MGGVGVGWVGSEDRGISYRDWQLAARPADIRRARSRQMFLPTTSTHWLPVLRLISSAGPPEAG